MKSIAWRVRGFWGDPGGIESKKTQRDETRRDATKQDTTKPPASGNRTAPSPAVPGPCSDTVVRCATALGVRAVRGCAWFAMPWWLVATKNGDRRCPSELRIPRQANARQRATKQQRPTAKERFDSERRFFCFVLVESISVLFRSNRRKLRHSHSKRRPPPYSEGESPIRQAPRDEKDSNVLSACVSRKTVLKRKPLELLSETICIPTGRVDR